MFADCSVMHFFVCALDLLQLLLNAPERELLSQ